MKNFITTSIPYINDNPHIGHLYEFLLADIFARYKKLNNEEVFLQSGTDENGLKIAKTAEEKNISINEFVDDKYKSFYNLTTNFNLSFDKFVRTSSPEHRLAVYKFWKLCEKDIYIGEYNGFYCIGCENYYDESEVKDLICPIHKKKLEKFEEKNYFFKLSKYLNEIKNLIEKDKIKIHPQEKKIEILNILKESKLKDLSISRDAQRSKGWGIPVYNDNSQIIYVWFDALINYLTGLGFGSKDESLFENFWNNGTIYHFIGKDILKFHAIYWPAMLLSANLKVPENIFVHFHIIIEGEKMSKTLGNVISPESFLEKYHYEAARFYFAHQPVFKDWNFTWNEFENFYQGVLKKDLANLILRIFGILNKIESKEIKIINTNLDHNLEELENNFKTKIENLEFDAAYGNSLDFLHSVNKFIDKNKIWETKKENDLSFLIKSLLLIIKLYSPLLPKTISSLQKKIEIKDKIYLNNKIKLKPFYK